MVIFSPLQFYLCYKTSEKVLKCNRLNCNVIPTQNKLCKPCSSLITIFKTSIDSETWKQQKESCTASHDAGRVNKYTYNITRSELIIIIINIFENGIHRSSCLHLLDLDYTVVMYIVWRQDIPYNLQWLFHSDNESLWLSCGHLGWWFLWSHLSSGENQWSRFDSNLKWTVTHSHALIL